MLITNNYNLPPAMYQAIAGGNREPKDGQYSITELITPPFQGHLRRKHWPEITEDVSDRLWALLGSATHYWLDKANADGAGEERMFHELEGLTITGQPDLIVNNEIHDYKVTSTWSAIDGKPKPEWVAQLNAYRWLYYKTSGKTIDNLFVYAILRDWQAGKALGGNHYPAIPFVTLHIPVWDMAYAEADIMARLTDHTAKTPRPCTDEEKWLKKSCFAVMKEGRKSAVRLFESQIDAEAFLSGLDRKHSIVERKGKYGRCEQYCNVNKWCPAYQVGIMEVSDEDSGV